MAMQLLFLNNFVLPVSPLRLLQMTSFLFLKSLHLRKLRKPLLLIRLVLLLDPLELLLFDDFHPPLFKCLGDKHLKYGINFLIEVKQILAPYLGLLVDSCFLWNEEPWKGSVDVEVGLAFFFTLGRFIRQQFLILICLYKNMLSIRHRRWCISPLSKLLLDADPGLFDLLLDLFHRHVTSPLLLLRHLFLLGNNCCIGVSSNNSWVIHGIPELVTNLLRY